MARCEDCGHDICPDYKDGRQVNTCGAELPLNSTYSLCESCLNSPDPDDKEIAEWDGLREIAEWNDPTDDLRDFVDDFYEPTGDFENS